MNNSSHTLFSCKVRAKEILDICLGFSPLAKTIKITYADNERLEFIINNKGYCVCKSYIGKFNYNVYMYTVIESDGNFKDGIEIGGVNTLFHEVK